MAHDRFIPGYFQIIYNTWCCRDRKSSCNIYAVQQDTKVFLMSEFCSARMLPRHVSDFTEVTAGRVEYYHIPNLQIQLVQNAADAGPVRSETCRANLSAE